MISRTSFCSAQTRVIVAMRFGLMPGTSVRRCGWFSMTSNTASLPHLLEVIENLRGRGGQFR